MVLDVRMTQLTHDSRCREIAFVLDKGRIVSPRLACLLPGMICSRLVTFKVEFTVLALLDRLLQRRQRLLCLHGWVEQLGLNPFRFLLKVLVKIRVEHPVIRTFAEESLGRRVDPRSRCFGVGVINRSV